MSTMCIFIAESSAEMRSIKLQLGFFLVAPRMSRKNISGFSGEGGGGDVTLFLLYLFENSNFFICCVL